ncbi:MAG: hypothetical protein LBT55_00270 [Clostridiaceae bacterium]|jgi:hypothetical protein|nr:hypothetical protein [Clostridiaceae bacterium]
MDFDFSENDEGILFRPYDKRDKTAAMALLSEFWHINSLARKDDIRELMLNREFHRALSSNNYCEVAEADGMFKGIIFADINVIDAKNRPMDKVIFHGYDTKLKALVGEDFRSYTQLLLIERTRTELLTSLAPPVPRTENNVPGMNVDTYFDPDISVRLRTNANIDKSMSPVASAYVDTGVRFDAELSLILSDPDCPEAALLLFERLKTVLRENLARNYFVFSNTFCDYRLFQLKRCVKWAEKEITLISNNPEQHKCRIYAYDF